MALSKLSQHISKKFRMSEPPVEKEIEDFIMESVKFQTAYANLEGVYSRRIISPEDKNTLENFVYCTMYYNRCKIWDTDSPTEVGLHVKRIVSRIILISKDFNTNGGIHLGVVWVYYFCYENKTHIAIPIFKIYKKESENDAVFLDVSLNLYSDWINYLDSAEFPRVFLCWPQDGEYTFLKKGEKKKLNLIYQVVENRLVNKSTQSTKKFWPCSKLIIEKWKYIMSSITKENLQEIKAICGILVKKINGLKHLLFNCVVFGFLVWLKVKESGMQFHKALKMIAMESLMFLNTRIMDLSSDNFSTDLLSDLLSTRIQGFENFMNSKETLQYFGSDACTLVDLFKKPQKNWEAILQVFCALFRNASPILDALLFILPLPPTLRQILLILKSFSKLCGAFFLSSGEGRNNTLLNTEKKMNGKEIISPGDYKLSNENRIENIQMAGCSKEKDESFQFICDKVFEKVIENFSLSEEIYGEEVHNMFFEEFELKMQQVGKPTFTSSVLFVGELEEYGIFFMPSASLPHLTFNMKLVLEEEFSYKPEGIAIYKVVLTSGKVPGTLYFPFDFCTVGLFSLEAIKKSGKMSPLVSTR